MKPNKIKKVYIALILIIVFGLCIFLSACKDGDGGVTPNIYAERSYELQSFVIQNYWSDSYRIVYSVYPNPIQSNYGSIFPASVWPFSAVMSSCARIAKLFPNDSKIREEYINVLEGLEYYRMNRDDYLSYSSGLDLGNGKSANADCYYDDNIWLARELLTAYEILGGEQYFNKAKDLAEYVWSGWADDSLGGIYWREYDDNGNIHKQARHTCSTAPASELFSRLYLKTQDEKYLERAKKTYDFCHDKLLDADGVYLDHVRNNGTVDRAKYTYNTGTMISSGIYLYKITNDTKYLEHAKFSAEGAFNYFFKENPDYSFKIITQYDTWFNALLLDGYINLYQYDTGALKYIQAVEQNINYAYENYLTSIGIIPSNWIKGFDKDKDGNDKLTGVDVRLMAANAEIYAMLALFYS